MARLTKAQRETLQHVLHDAMRACAYVSREDICVGIKKRLNHALPSDFTRLPLSTAYRESCLIEPERSAPDYALTVVAKDIGSDLVGLRRAANRLAEFLED